MATIFSPNFIQAHLFFKVRSYLHKLYNPTRVDFVVYPSSYNGLCNLTHKIQADHKVVKWARHAANQDSDNDVEVIINKCDGSEGPTGDLLHSRPDCLSMRTTAPQHRCCRRSQVWVTHPLVDGLQWWRAPESAAPGLKPRERRVYGLRTCEPLFSNLKPMRPASQQGTSNTQTHAEDATADEKTHARQGGNFDKTVFSEAAAYMAKEFPPKAGGLKTANSIADKWKAVQKLHEHFLKIKQGVYVGASGWTYTDEGGFNVTDDTRDVWHNFIKAHSHFKNFATHRWAHFQVVDNIVPSHARGCYVFSAGAMQADSHSLKTSLDNDDGIPPSDALTQSSDLSQLLTNWSQTNVDRSQMSDVLDPVSSSQIGMTQSQSTFQVAHRIPTTPAPALKHAAAENIETPWSSKRSRTTGPDSILTLSRSIDGIGKVIENVFAPKKSSAMSPTKVAAAHKLALEDADGGYIAASDRTYLNILFGRDTTDGISPKPDAGVTLSHVLEEAKLITASVAATCISINMIPSAESQLSTILCQITSLSLLASISTALVQFWCLVSISAEDKNTYSKSTKIVLVWLAINNWDTKPSSTW
ncbi:hypothetical protein DFH08DRAFT_797408 [Mycena albidolilacea]|uniref:Uncharacterized protein n=1 Tax=Mycena albidolilacea TaxID=1033008 RepID=A0AAD7F585_9AGAR|nr:hypothetical protein DFH08DRAFT_797408 [Mycena albidolilacea]